MHALGAIRRIMTVRRTLAVLSVFGVASLVIATILNSDWSHSRYGAFVDVLSFFFIPAIVLGVLAAGGIHNAGPFSTFFGVLFGVAVEMLAIWLLGDFIGFIVRSVRRER